MELESLTTDEWELSVRRSLRPLFGRLDPFAPAIAPSVEARALLFPTDRRLSATEASAVLEAAEAIGETRVCLTLTEAHQPMGGNFDRGPHLLFDLSAYSEAVDGSPVAVLENALYSVEGGWGILSSNEDHSVIAGQSGFVEAVVQNWPSPLEGTGAFVEYWKESAEKYGSALGWLDPLLAEVGPAR